MLHRFLWLIVCGLILSCQTPSSSGNLPLTETHSSLSVTPQGAVELARGVYHSHMLGTACPFRVFSPTNPQWEELDALSKSDPVKGEGGGMSVAIYVLNLKGQPRPSQATDRQIIEDLIRDNFLVVTVDFGGGRITSPLDCQKDINGLYLAFGGGHFSKVPWFTENRQKLLNYPGPNKDLMFTSYTYKKKDSTLTIPTDKRHTYVLPAGYTVKKHIVFKTDYEGAKDAKNNPRKFLFMDVIHPKESDQTLKLPLLLEMSSTGIYDSAININTVVLYSWLFNGYALASMGYSRNHIKGPDRLYPLQHAIRYLRHHKNSFSLSGKVGTAGISKSCGVVYITSNMDPKIPTEVDKEVYGKESGKVDICMPAVGLWHRDVLNNLHKDSPPLVLTWCHLNYGKRYDGYMHRSAVKSYEKAGIRDKLLYFENPLAGHEYDVFNLNEILKFFDKYCK